MSIDDPGWGGDSFGAGSGGSGGGWGSPDDKPPRTGLSWKRPAVVGGVAAALVIIVVVVLVLSVHGSKNKNTADVTTHPSGSTSASASTTPSTTPTTAKPTPTKPAALTLAEYDTRADAVCTTWKARVTAANDAVSTPAQLKTVALPVLAGEVADLKKIPRPSTETSQQELWLTQIGTVLSNLSSESVSALNPSITTADTTAGDLGMKVCNYGY